MLPSRGARHVAVAAVAALAQLLTAAAGSPFAPLSAEGQCDEESALAAFAAGGASEARAILGAFKDGTKEQRDCAARVWKHGVDHVLPGAEEPGATAPGSQALQRLGGLRGRCAAAAEDGTWLDIPRLQELAVCVRLPGGRELVLEQDGFLRAFDMATVLWPAGFFLMLWASNNCPLLEGRRVLELGAGVGGPSVVAAGVCGAARALATDAAAHGLANVRTNARINGAAVLTQLFDWHSDEALDAAAAAGPFDVVLGAGLAPHRWEERLWAVLARLLRPGSGIAALCHGAGDVEGLAGGRRLGGGALRVERVVPGDDYGLQTRWGTPSEFEVAVLARVAPAPAEL